MRFRKERLYGIGQQVSGRVANDFQAFGVLVGNDAELCVVVDPERRIDQATVDFAGQRGPRQTRADALRHFRNRYRLREFPLRTVGQSNDRHTSTPEMKKARDSLWL